MADDPEKGPTPDGDLNAPVEIVAVGLEGMLDGHPDPEAAAQAINSPVQLWEAVQVNDYYELQRRVENDPLPTPDEIRMGAYVEEIEPQVRDAVMLMRKKGYNTMSSGFEGRQHEVQSIAFDGPVSNSEAERLREHGFVVETTLTGENTITFSPDNPLDLKAMKDTWDWLAGTLPDLGGPAEPAHHGNARAFQYAAEAGTLLDFYRPGGRFDPAGTKYVRERDPRTNVEIALSPEPAAATRELTFIDQYHELKNRLSGKPEPTEEEFNMGAYAEELEPQVREAVMGMRRKGYNTGSSGFWGTDHAEQAMDVATPIDDYAKARLQEHMIHVTDKGLRFRPADPTDMDAIKRTWDLVADILPDLGRHADPAQNHGADIFRYATRHHQYERYLEDWLWQAGAFSGSNAPLATVLLDEGRDFGKDVYAPQREAEAWHWHMAREAQLELEQGEQYGRIDGHQEDGEARRRYIGRRLIDEEDGKTG